MILRMICRHCKHDEFKIYTTVPTSLGNIKEGQTINPGGKDALPIEYGELQCARCGEIATINKATIG